MSWTQTAAQKLVMLVRDNLSKLGVNWVSFLLHDHVGRGEIHFEVLLFLLNLLQLEVDFFSFFSGLGFSFGNCFFFSCVLLFSFLIVCWDNVQVLCFGLDLLFRLFGFESVLRLEIRLNYFLFDSSVWLRNVRIF
jgi:hypothetical protein